MLKFQKGKGVSLQRMHPFFYFATRTAKNTQNAEVCGNPMIHLKKAINYHQDPNSPHIPHFREPYICGLNLSGPYPNDLTLDREIHFKANSGITLYSRNFPIWFGGKTPYSRQINQ